MVLLRMINGGYTQRRDTEKLRWVVIATFSTKGEVQHQQQLMNLHI